MSDLDEYLNNINKEETCKGCPQIDDCDNETPINCLRRWNYMFSGTWN